MSAPPTSFSSRDPAPTVALGPAAFTHQRRIAQVCAWTQLTLLLVFTGCWLLAPQRNDLAIACGYLGLLGSLAPVAYMLYWGRPPLLFNALTGFNIAPIWFLYLETVLPGHDAFEYTPANYRLEAFWWIAVFMLTVNLLYLLLRSPLSRFSVRNFSYLREVSLGPRGYCYLTLFTFVFPLVAFLGYYGSPAVLWTAISGGRVGGGSSGGLLIQDAVGDSGSLMLPVNWLFQATPFFGMMAVISSRHWRSVWALGALALSFLTVFVFFLSGSRGITMYVAAPLLFGFFYYSWDKGLKFWSVAGLLFVLAIGVMELQVRFRGNLLDVLADPEKAAREHGYRSATTLDITESQRDNNTYLLGLILKGYPDKYRFEGFNNFVAVIVNPIPRTFWPGKPTLIGAKDLSQQDGFVLDGPLYMGTTSLSYSIVGEAYKARGIWGILVYAIPLTLFLVYFDALVYYTRVREELVVGLLGMSIFLAFWGFRSLFAFMTFLYPLLLIVCVLYGLALFRRLSLRIH